MFDPGWASGGEWVEPALPDLAARFGFEQDDRLAGAQDLLDGVSPGAELGANIEQVAASMPSLGGAGCEAMLEAVRRQEARTAALKLQALARLLAWEADRPTNPYGRRDVDAQAMEAATASAMVTLRVPKVTAADLLDLAARLDQDYPTTMRWLSAGTIDLAHARAIVQELSFSDLAEEFRSDLEEELLGYAPHRTAKTVREKAQKLIAAHDPAEARRRRKARAKERDVTTRDEGEGMASLTWRDEAGRIHAAREHLQELSDAQAPGDERAAHQRRADAAADLFGVGPSAVARNATEDDEVDEVATFSYDPIPDAAREGFEADSRAGFDPHTHPADTTDTVPSGEAAAGPRGPGEARGARPADPASHQGCPECAAGAIAAAAGGSGAAKGVVHLDLITLQRMAAGAQQVRDGAAYFEGAGWIDTDLAATLLKTAAKVEVVVTDPASGQCIYASEDQQYRHRAWQERTVERAHQVCRFPGCRQPARRCDHDHREEHATGGATCPHNLQPLCRSHHNLKTHRGWDVEPLDPLRPSGDLIWTSPAGRRYLDLLEEPLFRPPPRRGFGGDQEDPPF